MQHILFLSPAYTSQKAMRVDGRTSHYIQWQQPRLPLTGTGRMLCVEHLILTQPAKGFPRNGCDSQVEQVLVAGQISAGQVAQAASHVQPVCVAVKKSKQPPPVWTWPYRQALTQQSTC
jgi:hypothetical protein